MAISILREEDLPAGTNESIIRSALSAYLGLLANTLPMYIPPEPPYPILKTLDPNFIFIPKTGSAVSFAEQVAKLAKIFEAAVEDKLQQECNAAGFDNIVNACAYAATVNPLQAQSISFVNWRAAIWVYCKDYLSKVQAGTLPIPDLPTFLASLPTRVLPV